jgi:hypothetical protein
MSANAATRLPIARIVAKGSCVICAALREFYTNLLKNLQPNESAHLCNVHAWAVARSAPAESAAAIFLEAVLNPEWKPSAANPEECDLCSHMQTEKEARLREIARELERPRLREWLEVQGTLCRRHGRELIKQLPDTVKKTVWEIMARNVAELEGELRDFLGQVKNGSHTGGGILGRAAEYLVAQRGIET